MAESSALVAGLMALIEEWRSTAAQVDNTAAVAIVEECADGVEDVINAALVCGPEEPDNGNLGVETV